MNCYNSDTYLRESIESVFNQTYENWEIIFWDNNSTDKSSDIFLTFKDKRLKYFKASETEPLYSARNLALDKCNGDYIAFLDCDDIWLEYKLEEQVNVALQGINFVYGAYATIDKDKTIMSDNLNYLVSGDITNSLFRRNPISIGTVLVEKKLIDNLGFDPVFNLLGDLDMWVRLSLICDVCPVNRILEYSRQHEKNTSIALKDDWKSERRHFYKKYLTPVFLLKNPWLILYIIKTEIFSLIRPRL